MTSSDHFAKSSWMLTLVSVAVVVAVLYLAKGILIPLTLALLLSFLLAPACDWLERRRLGRIPSVLITVVVAFTSLGAGAWTAAVQIVELAPKIPEYQSNIRTRLHSVNNYFNGVLRKVKGTAEGVGEILPLAESVDESDNSEVSPTLVRVVPASQSPLDILGSVFGSMLMMIGSAGIVAVLIVFFLFRRDDIRDRVIYLIGRGHVTVTTQTLEDAANRVSRYLLTQLLINATYGILVAVGLYSIGVPNAVLWGILATVLRFIPYIGPWIAAAAPVGLSLAMSTNWVAPTLTIGLFVVLELVVNNVMEPLLYGKNTGMSAVAILVAAIFWTWLWGPAGLLLATPLTVCLLVIGKHVPHLSFLDTLLGNEPVFELKNRIYQRLLAGDQEEATELLLNDAGKRTLVEVYDTVLIPALALTELHLNRGELEESRHKFMFQSLRALIEELGDRRQAMQAKDTIAGTEQVDADPELPPPINPSMLSVLCVPAHDEADEIAATMLAQLLEPQGCLVHVVPVADLTSGRVDWVEQHRADIVCISATRPAAVTHARHLFRRLRGHWPEANLVIGLWDTKGDLGQARERIGCGAATQLFANLADAQEKIHRINPLTVQRSDTQLKAASRPTLVLGLHHETVPETVS